jgi:SH3-like domain-containing protein
MKLDVMDVSRFFLSERPQRGKDRRSESPLSGILMHCRFAVFVLALLPSCFAAAADNPPAAGKPSAPYFVSMKNDTTNMREGPSADTRIKWVYHRKGLPVEVVATFDAWRRVRDIDGEIGWIHMALLSRERTAVVKGNGDVEVHSSADAGSKTVAQAEPGAIGILRGCGTAACRVRFDGAEGWVERAHLWGVRDGEQF